MIKHPEARILWYVIVALAASMTTRISYVSDLLYQITRIDEIATLTKHLLGILAITMLLRWVLAVIPGSEDGQPEPRYRRTISNRPRRIVTRVAVVAITVVFPWANRRPGPHVEDADFIFVQAGHFWGSVHLVLFYLYVVYGMSCAAIMCADAGRRDRLRNAGRPTVLGRGLQSMAIGCAVGVFYGGLRITYLIIRLMQRAFIGGDVLVASMSNASLILCVMLTLFGCCAPMVDRINRALAAHGAITDLRPMWLHMTAATPSVVLDPFAGAETTGTVRLPRKSNRCLQALRAWLKRLPLPLRIRRRYRDLKLALSEARNWRDLEFRLRRRVIEICDSAMILQSYVPPGLPEETAAIVKTTGMPAEATAAYLLHVAIRRQQAGLSPNPERSRRALVRVHDDLFQATHATLLPIWTQMRSRPVISQLRRRTDPMGNADTPKRTGVSA
ncbi:DUF6545 domain-containing protein [Streptomyces sp. NPDC008079]|uniref:DUF6545 domain-containing protein n=1 Tax=Streptomyces sp. NPDC008079 TaxID=3364806 RepID=UPI0036E5D09F